MNCQQQYPINKDTDVDGAILQSQLSKATQLDTCYLGTPCLQIRNGRSIVSKITVQSQQYKVHRFIWYYHYPFMPLESNIKWKCKTFACMNIDHLTCITKKQHSAARKDQPRVQTKTLHDVISVPYKLQTRTHEELAFWIFTGNDKIRYVDVVKNLQRINAIPLRCLKTVTAHDLMHTYGLDSALFLPAYAPASVASALGFDKSDILNFEPEDVQDLHELEVYGDN